MVQEFRRVLLGLPLRAETSGNSPALAYATTLCVSFKSHLTVNAIISPAWASIGFSVDSADVIAASNKGLEDDALTMLRAAETFITEAGVHCTIDEPHTRYVRDLADRMKNLARINDLTIIDADTRMSGDVRFTIEEVLFDGSCPVIVVPTSGGKAVPEHIAIAWDGSARAARAIKEALPFLKAAKNVSVVTIAGDKDLSGQTTPTDLQHYLASHSVNAQPVNLATVDNDPMNTLRSYLSSSQADMLVMGAFVHSRFRQVVFGSFTRAFLDDTPLPVFMAY